MISVVCAAEGLGCCQEKCDDFSNWERVQHSAVLVSRLRKEVAVESATERLLPLQSSAANLRAQVRDFAFFVRRSVD